MIETDGSVARICRTKFDPMNPHPPVTKRVGIPAPAIVLIP
jgi:hypothetical protein